MPFEKLQIPMGRAGWIRSYSPADGGQVHLHAHRELEVNLILKGQGSYLIQGGRYAIEPGSLLWLFPGQPHLLVEASPDFLMWVGVFRPRLVRNLTASAADPEIHTLQDQDPGEVYVRTLKADGFKFLDGLFKGLHTVAPGDDAYFNHGLGYLLRSSWEAGLKARPLISVARVHPAVERALHLLQQGDEGSLSELAARSGISYSRLCNLFTSQIGETLNQFRSRMRLRRFQDLAAAYPDRTLLDLALDAGFGSYAQCHRMVVRLTGEPPRALR